MDLQRAMSSAKRDIVLPGGIWLTISLMKIKNNKGPSTDPCGTPEMTGTVGKMIVHHQQQLPVTSRSIIK